MMLSWDGRLSSDGGANKARYRMQGFMPSGPLNFIIPGDLLSGCISEANGVTRVTFSRDRNHGTNVRLYRTVST
jgi:hypothetical protein